MKHRALTNTPPASEKEWRSLFVALQAENARFAAVSEFSDHTLPNPPATENDLLAAETRLGHPLAPELRTMLMVADGWDDYTIGCSILGTADFGQSERWIDSLDCLRIWESDGDSDFLPHHLGIADDDRSPTYPIIHYDNGYQSHAYMFSGNVDGNPVHGVFSLGVIEDEKSPWPDLHTYLSDELPVLRDIIDHEEMGPHSYAWSRDIRVDPPGFAEIIEMLEALSARIDDGPFERFDAADTRVLQSIEGVHGHPLSDLHRELLETTDGLVIPRFGRVVSAAEIIDTDAWQQLVDSAIDAAVDPWYESHLVSNDELGIRRANLATRMSRLSTIPFLVSSGPYGVHSILGVDVVDGSVRNLTRDPAVATDRLTHEPTTDVREFLLTVADRLYETARSADHLKAYVAEDSPATQDPHTTSE
ncbi:SMI1/KNR4 family protein [Gordonia polyisoprenivorans]|uniref:SMI1/KNR4 family protein n=1 Tax=Gordonia polyisoprenivorans TaxID=84595 RepID=UPI001AD74D67|nr:SMI1/KNR4 family protein [Gordonia polyisoprenivorans]QTI67809.1 SMI1/KNR4 family protein [Gordonia polyisoprenivorans]